MKLYYHLDRQQYLKPGDILKSHRVNASISLSLMPGIVDADFIDHLNALNEKGLSSHGVRYLVSSIQDAIGFADLMVEFYWEYIRWKEYADKPSRFQSYFGWDDIGKAVEFARTAGVGAVFEVSNDGRHHVADMNLVKLDYDRAEQDKRARLYWESKPMSTAIDYSPRWEYLIVPPVAVGQSITIRP